MNGHDREHRAPMRIVGEFVLIVASVLVALAAQSAWQYHEDREKEADYLRAIYGDAMINRDAIHHAMEEDKIFHSRAERFFKVLNSNAPLPSDSLNSWMRVSYSDFYPVTGTLQALIASGDIRLIRSDSIRYAARQLASDYDGVRDDLAATVQAAWNLPLWSVFARHRTRTGLDEQAFREDPELFSLAIQNTGINATRISVLLRLDSANNKVLRLTAQK